MDRREFLKDFALVTAATRCLPDSAKPGERSGPADLSAAFNASATSGAGLDIEGHMLICEFKIEATMWKVYEGPCWVAQRGACETAIAHTKQFIQRQSQRPGREYPRSSQ